MMQKSKVGFIHVSLQEVTSILACNESVPGPYDVHVNGPYTGSYSSLDGCSE